VSYFGQKLEKKSEDTIVEIEMVLANKLVVYNLENLVVGWMDHNCSSSIKMKDDVTGGVYDIGGRSHV